MKNFLLALSLLITLNGFSQNIEDRLVHSFYLECLTDFLLNPIELHKKDKKEFIVMNNENMSSPDKIGDKNILWSYGKIEIPDLLKGNKKKHNGRSAITLSYKLIKENLIVVQVHQWFLSHLEHKEYGFNPIPNSNMEYAKKENQYYFEKKDNVWVFKEKRP